MYKRATHDCPSQYSRDAVELPPPHPQLLFLLLLEVHFLLINSFCHSPISVQSLVLGHRNLGLSADAQWMLMSTCGKVYTAKWISNLVSYCNAT